MCDAFPANTRTFDSLAYHVLLWWISCHSPISIYARVKTVNSDVITQHTSILNRDLSIIHCDDKWITHGCRFIAERGRAVRSHGIPTDPAPRRVASRPKSIRWLAARINFTIALSVAASSARLWLSFGASFSFQRRASSLDIPTMELAFAASAILYCAWCERKRRRRWQREVRTEKVSSRLFAAIWYCTLYYNDTFTPHLLYDAKFNIQ